MIKLRKSTTLFLFILLSLTVQGQDFSHQISFPFISYQTTNVNKEANGLNREYYNEKYIPNFRYEAKYKKVSLGLEHYYANNFFYNDEVGVYKLRRANLDVYSLFLGYTIDVTNWDIKFGVGANYNKNPILTYSIFYIFEGYYCYKTNKYSPLAFVTIERDIYKNIFVGANFRYAPMLQNFKDEHGDYSYCGESIGVSKFNYVVGQLMIGYRFGM